MTAKRKLVIEAARNIVVLALLYGLLAVPMYLISNEAGDLWRLALIVLPFFGNFMLRRLVKNFWLALPLHFAFPAAAIMLTSGVFYTLVWLAGTAVAAFFSLRHYFKSRDAETDVNEGFFVIVVIGFIVVSLWAVSAGHFTLAAVYPFLTAIILIGRTAVLHMLQIDKSLAAIGLSSEQPVRKIIAFNYKLVAGLCAAVLALALMFFFAVTGPVAGFIERRLAEREFIPPEFESGISAPRFSPSEFITHQLQGELPEPTRMTEMLDLLLTILFALIAAAFVCLVVFTAARALMRGVNRRDAAAPLRDGAEEDEREFIYPRPKGKSRRNPQGEHPTRRLFREKIARHIKKGVPFEKSDTPSDMASRIQKEDISELAAEYSEVRYRCESS